MTSTVHRRSRVDVEAWHLVATRTHENGNQHHLHVKDDGDLAVTLGKGGDDIGLHVEEGLVLVALGIDGDHDQVSVSGRTGRSMVEVVAQALEALELAHDALRRVEGTSG